MSARWIARVGQGNAASARIAPAGPDVAASAEIARGTKAVQDRAFRLKLADGVVYAESAGKHLFLQPEAPDWMVVNQKGAILLSRCDGATMEEVLGAAGESGWEQASVLFAEALARGVLVNVSAEPKMETLKTMRRKQREIPQKLSMVHLKLTNQCNLGCSYCYAHSGKRSDALSWGDLETIARDVAALSDTVSYVLSGGEPLLHPSVLDFAETVKAAGNKVHLLTNGTLIDGANAARIATVADVVKISVDGSSDAVHSATRGKGNFARVTRAIELLLGSGANVVVAMTVTRANCGDIAAMVARYGFRLALQPLFRAGRGSAADHLALTGIEYYRALAEVQGGSADGSRRPKAELAAWPRRAPVRHGRERDKHRGDGRRLSLPTAARRTVSGGERAGAVRGRDLFRLAGVCASETNQRGYADQMLCMRRALSLRRSLSRARFV